MKKINLALSILSFSMSAFAAQGAPSGDKIPYTFTENVDVAINANTFRVDSGSTGAQGCPPRHACDPIPPATTIWVNYAFNNGPIGGNYNGPYAINGFKYSFRSNQFRNEEIQNIVQTEASQSGGTLPATLTMTIDESADDEYGCDGKTPDGKPADIMVCCHKLTESVALKLHVSDSALDKSGLLQLSGSSSDHQLSWATQAPCVP